FCAGEFIPNEAKRIFENLEKQNYLKDSKSLDSFAHKFADLMSDLNALHPFREGNGRTQRIFLNQLAQNTGYKLDLNLTPKDKMIEASISGMQGNNLKLESIIRLNLKSFKQNLSKE
ncbi:Fic/DOC family protein, partial [Helicobacter monodelphidis]|uniref:Fic/DOC family protein n=1 Tax=Helicobacter sp. 15-1451 TaxID=2004995 RepID=UPI0015EC70FA